MSAQTESQKRINELKAELARLEGQAVKELKDKREALLAEVAVIDQQIAELTGTEVSASQRKRAPKEAAKSLPLQELKEMLSNAPDRTLNVRKSNLDLRNIKVLAEANPHLLKIGGNGPWPTVTLLK